MPSPNAVLICPVAHPVALCERPAYHARGLYRTVHGSNSEIRAKVYRFLLQRKISSNVAPCVREHLVWEYENGSPIQIFNFHSLEHLTLQAALPLAKRRAANHILPQPAFSQELPQPPVFCIFQEEPTRFFFHEYGRRVGMVPRSSLKGGKNSLMVEKRTRRPNTTQTKQPKAHRPSLHHHVVFPLR